MSEKLSEEKRNLFEKRIQEFGFIKDELVGKEIDKQVYGVNITCAWPLPVEIKETYEILCDKLKELEGVYIYPYSQTHITILTIINFKKRLDQPKQVLNRDTIKVLTSKIKEVLKQKPIQISIGSPILAREAASLPVYNPTREIDNMRKQAAGILRVNDIVYDLEIPDSIHSTILRFKEAPSDRTEFLRRFKQITKGCVFREGKINNICITEEIKPYMKEARILDKIELRCSG
jgi:hypothetical protein